MHFIGSDTKLPEKPAGGQMVSGPAQRECQVLDVDCDVDSARLSVGLSLSRQTCLCSPVAGTFCCGCMGS